MELTRHHSSTLLNSFSENIKLRASNHSFAEKLIKAADYDNLLKEMNKLSTEVVLHTDVINTANRDERGKVYAFEVRVHCEGDQLVVTKKVRRFKPHICCLLMLLSFYICIHEQLLSHECLNLHGLLKNKLILTFILFVEIQIPSCLFLFFFFLLTTVLSM